MQPAPELAAALQNVKPGRALDLACGYGRHAIWLAERGWQVTAVDIARVDLPGIDFVQADLELGEFRIETNAWDLIVCWLYWQPDLLPGIRAGIRAGGIVAMAGKTSGRFATSSDRITSAFNGWHEIAAGESERIVWKIVQSDRDEFGGFLPEKGVD